MRKEKSRRTPQKYKELLENTMKDYMLTGLFCGTSQQCPRVTLPLFLSLEDPGKPFKLLLPLPHTPHPALHRDALLPVASSDSWLQFHFLHITDPQTDQCWTFPSQLLEEVVTIHICKEICLRVDSIAQFSRKVT